MRQFLKKPFAVGLLPVMVWALTGFAQADPLYSTTVHDGSSIDPADIHGAVVPSGHSVVVSPDKDTIDALDNRERAHRRAVLRRTTQARMAREHPIRTRWNKAKKWFAEKF